MKNITTWYKINAAGSIKPTRYGWCCLVAWAYFVSRLVLSFIFPEENSSQDIHFYLFATIAAITLFIGTQLLFTLLYFTHKRNKRFRTIATHYWMEQINQKIIPMPPVKKMLYNYSTFTTTLIYPNAQTFRATFHITFDADGFHSEGSATLIEL